MAIFVIEDDPQDGFDHVDGHRSVCLVASPFAKRGQVVSEFYNQASVVHTIEQILGVRAENQMYARAPVMATCFTSEADLSPYTVPPNTVPLCELNPPKSALRGEALRWAEASESLDFQGVDQAEEETLNRVLWFAMKGEGAPYPAEFEGAHAKGLKALGLTLGQAPGNAPVKPDPAR